MLLPLIPVEFLGPGNQRVLVDDWMDACCPQVIASGLRVEVKIETVPQRVARAALQLGETGLNGSSSHAQTG